MKDYSKLGGGKLRPVLNRIPACNDMNENPIDFKYCSNFSCKI